MLLSDAERCRYETSTLHEVICQLRFPAILSIDTREPADFQEQIRAVFPRYAVQKETPPAKLIRQGGAQRLETEKPINNYTFLSANNLWKLNLTRDFIALSTLRYSSWEDFAKMLDQTLVAFIRTYQPAFFERIGLRYMNFISREKLGLSSEPWNALLADAYLGPLAEDDMIGRIERTSLDFEMNFTGNAHCKVHAGPAHLQLKAPNAPPKVEEEEKFMLDLDFSMRGSIAPNLAAAGLETLHSYAYPVFRGAITETLHNAMGPMD